jgi:hypothetical protein
MIMSARHKKKPPQGGDGTGHRKLDFCATIMGLRGRQRSVFRRLTTIPSFEETAANLAPVWRTQLRPRCGDEVLCRHHMAVCTLLPLLKNAPEGRGRYQLAAALALAMADRVQDIVADLDRRERSDSGRN